MNKFLLQNSAHLKAKKAIEVLRVLQVKRFEGHLDHQDRQVNLDLLESDQQQKM